MAGKTFHPNRAQHCIPLQGSLEAGSAVANGVALSVLFVTAGAARGRIYFKCSAGGTLSLKGVRAQQTNLASPTTYDTVLATDTVVANTELPLDFDLSGEHAVLITFLPSGNGTVTWADAMAV